MVYFYIRKEEFEIARLNITLNRKKKIKGFPLRWRTIKGSHTFDVYKSSERSASKIYAEKRKKYLKCKKKIKLSLLKDNISVYVGKFK